MSTLVPLYVILPLATAFLIPIFGRLIKGFQKILLSLVLIFLTGLTFMFLLNGIDSTISYKVGGWEAINEIPIAIYLVMDGLSAFLLLIINLVGFLSAFYAISYIKRYTAENNFYALLSLMIAGMNGVVLTGDMFNLYVFLEISVIASYALVAFGTERTELEASFKYQVLGGVASLLILFAIGMLYWKTQTLNMADISRVLASSDPDFFIIFTQVLLISGFGLKAAMIPFHAWLPDAHSSAPSPISAMLSGVLIKAVGVYAIIRLFFNVFALSIEISTLITVIGTLSMIIGGLLAIFQWDMKRMLAYSSISQMGYVFIGLGMGMTILVNDGNPTIAALAIFGGLFHMINHATFKGLLFLNAGAIEYTTGTRNMKMMGGLAHSMPVTASTSLGASMSISGIPPFNGFFSKLIIVIAAIKGGFYLLATLAIIISIVTLVYFLRFQRFAFYNKTTFTKKTKEVPFTMCFSMIVLVILCVVLSTLAIPGVREVFVSPAVDVLLETTNYATKIIGM
ncbi:MAG: proton-conducting transporter membrane subunit [Bacteroidales bacterium]